MYNILFSTYIAGLVWQSSSYGGYMCRIVPIHKTSSCINKRIAAQRAIACEAHGYVSTKAPYLYPVWTHVDPFKIHGHRGCCICHPRASGR